MGKRYSGLSLGDRDELGFQYAGQAIGINQELRTTDPGTDGDERILPCAFV
jgi:hypothetical protein